MLLFIQAGPFSVRKKIICAAERTSDSWSACPLWSTCRFWGVLKGSGICMPIRNSSITGKVSYVPRNGLRIRDQRVLFGLHADFEAIWKGPESACTRLISICMQLYERLGPRDRLVPPPERHRKLSDASFTATARAPPHGWSDYSVWYLCAARLTNSYVCVGEKYVEKRG